MKKLVAFGVSLYLAFALSPAMAAAETICSDETLAPSDEAPAADLVLPDEAEGDMSADEAVLADEAVPAEEVAPAEKAIAEDEGAESDPNAPSDSSAVTEEAEPVVEGVVLEKTAEAPSAVEQEQADQEGPLDDGAVYTLAPSYAQGMRVRAEGSATSSSANVSLGHDFSLLGEFWRALRHQDDDTYSFVNVLGERALGISGTPAAGANVQCTTGDGARWHLLANLDGTFSIVPAGYDNLRLDVAGAGSAAGSNLVLWLENGGANQRFALKKHEALTEAARSAATVEEGVYALKAADGSNRALDVAWASTDLSANVMVFASNTGFNQKYYVKPVARGIYEIQATHSGKLVEVYGGAATAGANVTQYARNGMAHQLWYFVKSGDSYSIRSAKSGLELCVAPSGNVELGAVRLPLRGAGFSLQNAVLLEDGSVYSFAPGYAPSLRVASASNSGARDANVQIDSAVDVLGQFWRVKAERDGSISLINLRSNGVLGIAGSAKTAANVVIDGSGSTLWTVSYNDGGTLSLHPKGNARLALDIPYASSASGANVWLWESIGSLAQRFVASAHGPLTEAARVGKTVEEGIYSILSAADKNLALDISGASKDNCAQVLLFAAGDKANQKFELSYAGNGLYTLRAAISGKLVELYGASPAQGTPVKQFVSNGGIHQLWYFAASGDGYYIRSAKGGLAMAFAGGAPRILSDVTLETQQAHAQRMVLKEVPLVADGTYVISSELALPLVLDVFGASKDAGANVGIYQSTGGKNQQFVFKHLGDGAYRITNKGSGLVLEVAGGSSDYLANVQQWSNLDEDHQKWRLGVSDFGGITFKSVKSGLFLDVEGGVRRNCTNVIQWGENRGAGQSFNLKAGSWSFGAEVERIARTQMGTRYSYVGSGYFPNSAFNCSGLTWWVYNQAGYNVSHNQGYYSYYTGSPNKEDSQMWQVERAGNWKTNPAELVKGDLVFFSPANDKWHTGHVGIYIGNNKMIHVWPTTGTAVVDIYSLPKDHFVGGGLPL